MAYDSRVRGMIPIHPPIPVRRLRHSKFLPDENGRHHADVSVLFVVATTYEDRHDGILVKSFAAGIMAAYEEPFAAYELGKHLDEVAAEVVAVGAWCDSDAELIRIGTDLGDVERYWFDAVEELQSGERAQTHLTEKAELRWTTSGRQVELP